MIIRIVGESGEGIVSTGEIISRVLQHKGKNIVTFRTYPAEIKGGIPVFASPFDPSPEQQIVGAELPGVFF